MLALNFNNEEKSLLRNVRIGALFTFIAVNLRFVVGDIIKPLILFDVIQPGGHGHGHKYEFHTPNLPDMSGDVITIILFGLAYMFISSSSIKNIIRGMMYTCCETESKSRESIRRMRDVIIAVKNLFYVAAVGFGLYFFSKYILTTGLEAFFSEESESEGIPFILNIINSAIKLCAALAFVYAYCKYLGAHRHTKIMLYMFFFIRSLLLTNMLGFVHGYDIEVGAPIIDVLLPGILIYATFKYLLRNKVPQQDFVEQLS